MQEQQENPLTPIKQITGLQQKTLSTIEYSHIEAFKSREEDAIKSIESLIANNQLSLAKQVAKNSSTLQNMLHCQLFQTDLQRILSPTTESHDLEKFIPYSQELTFKENQILGLTLKLKQKRSLNSSLMNVISQRLNDIIDGVEYVPQKQSGVSSNLFKKIYSPLLVIEKMVRQSASSKGAEPKRYQYQRKQQQQRLKVELQSLKKENAALLNKEKLNNEKIKELSRETKSQLAYNIRLKQDLNKREKQMEREREELFIKFEAEYNDLNNLVDAYLNSAVVYTEIGATIKDLKDLIFKLNQQNKILNDQKDDLNNKLTFLEVQINKTIISSQTESEPNEIVQKFQAKLRQQQAVIQELQAKVKELETRNLDESLSRSNSEFSLEDSRNKNQRLARTNPQRLGRAHKKKEDDPEILKEKIHSQYKLIENLESKVLNLQKHDMTDSLTISESEFNFSNLEQSMARSVTISKSSIQRLVDEKKQKQSQMQSLRQQVQKQLQEIAQLKEHQNESSTNEWQEKINKLEQIVKEQQQKVKNLTTTNKQLTKSNKEEIKLLKEKISSLEKKLSNKDIELETEKQSTKYLNLVLEDLKENHLNELKTQKDEKELLRKRVINLEEFIKQLEQNSKREQIEFENAMVEMKEREEKLQEQMKSISENSQVLSPHNLSDEKSLSEKKELQDSLSEKSEQYNELMVYNDIILKQKEQLRTKLSSTETMLEYTKAKHKESQAKLALFEKKLKTILAEEDFQKKYKEELVDHLFNCDILDAAPESKAYLKQLLQNRFQSKIFRTKLLYKLDLINKANFHQYIDNKEHLLVIVELTNGFLVAGYYHGKLVPKMTADKDAILISITNNEFFQLIQPLKKGVSYDDFFFILGNSQLRIKTGDTKFFSNFGIGSSYFKARGHKLATITGSNNREPQLVSFQFYEVIYL